MEPDAQQSDAAGPFAGLVVLDISQVFAGPLCSRLLAEMGATVIKVERPSGDVSRQLPFRIDGRSGYFVQQNRGKRSITIDLKSDDGKDLLWQLIEQADVALDGFAPGVLEGFGFSYDTMSARNPRIVLCELSVAGRSGPLGGMRGYDSIGSCLTGVAYTSIGTDESGERSGGPVMPSVAMGDAMMGLCAYGGILSALFERERSGRGQLVEVSLLDSYIQSHSNNLEAYYLSGGTLDTRRVGGQNATVCPNGPFPAPDGKWLYIAALSNEEWVRVANSIERPEMADDDRYRTNEGRVAHRDDVLGAIRSWIDSKGTRDAAVEALLAGGVSSAPVLSIAEVIEHPHLRARETVEMIEDPRLGTLPVPGSPFKLSRTRRTPLLPAPDLGAHSTEILRDQLGLSEDRIDAYVSAGVLGTRPAAGTTPAPANA